MEADSAGDKVAKRVGAKIPPLRSESSQTQKRSREESKVDDPPPQSKKPRTGRVVPPSAWSLKRQRPIEEEVDPKTASMAPHARFFKRQRTIGDEEQKEVDRLGGEIARIEKEIKEDAASYEQCRHVLSLGVTSLAAVEQTKKMDSLMRDLQRLKDERQKAINKKDAHLVKFLDGDENAMIVEEVREERAIRSKYFSTSKESRSEEAEIQSRINAKFDEKMAKRANSANCPAQCRNLVEDHVGCVLLCPECGYVYEDQRCNSENPVCTMGKFGEHADVPRRRSGGYKPPNHFAEIVGHFQGTRSSTAPPEILERVKDFCFRYKYEPREITPAVVRFFLRRMQQEENNRHANALAKNPKDRLRRFTDFYRSAPEMAYRLSGIPPPYMSPMQEDRVTALFPLVIAAYKTSPRYLKRMQNREDCIKKFPNNPNYSLVFYKECQLLGYDEFLPFIPLPKSTDNIDDNDTMAWMHICEVNGWQYIPTR